MSDLISVIIPAYNSENTIEIAIQSILDQTYSNLELIICDDGSQDRTLELIKSFKDDRIKILLNEHNLGNLLTTNKLLESCQGDFIALQDADDYSSKDRLEKQISKIKEKNVDLVSSSVGLVFKNRVMRVIRNPEYPLNFMNRIQVPIIWGACLFKKEIYKNIGGFDLVFNRIGAADYNWLQRASINYNFYNIQEVLYFYRQHGSSFTKSSIEINTNKLYSEEIAYDIYLSLIGRGSYDFDFSREIFKERSVYYESYHRKDNKKFLGLLYNRLIFDNLSYFIYAKEIFSINTSLIHKFKYLIYGLIVSVFGMLFVEKLKEMLRKDK